MSTSLLYHGFGVRGYRLLKTEFAKGEIVFHRARAIARGAKHCMVGACRVCPSMRTHAARDNINKSAKL